MRKKSFVPAADCLENRIALHGGGIKFIGGLPVLTSTALGETFSQVQKAFTTFATKGENYQLLSFNLTKAVGRIPFNVRDGLVATVQGEPAALQTAIANKTPLPVVQENLNTAQAVLAFVQAEVNAGNIIYLASNKK
jgi:hypothetical protein